VSDQRTRCLVKVDLKLCLEDGADGGQQRIAKEQGGE
jgi:hypothetical protein